MLSPEYVAGFFDGEGMVSLVYVRRRAWKSDPSKHILGFRMTVGVSNTNHAIIGRLREQFGGDVTLIDRKSGFHRQVLAWKMNGAERQKAFLSFIAPFAIVKAEAVLLGLEYLKTAVAPGQRLPQEAWERRIELCNLARDINRRGIPKSSRYKPPSDSPMSSNTPLRWMSQEAMQEKLEAMRAMRL